MAIQKYNMLSYDDRVVIGFSGGADSVALIALLTELRERLCLELTSVHINHGIRGAEADADEAFSREYCRRLNVPFLAFHEDAPQMAETMGLSLEEAGRYIRYQCFEQARMSRKANKIAVAHNSDDNAETVFMNICRGTGLSGLSGIPPVRGYIIRPLIETCRAEIERYLSEHGIPYRTDSTNLSGDYTRNRIRNTLIPEIDSILNVDFRQKLNALSRLCARDGEFINACALGAYEKALILEIPGNVSLSVSRLREFHPAVIARVIRLALSQWGLKDITARHIQAAENLLDAQSGKQTCLPGGLAINKYYDELCFSSAEKENPKAFRYDLKPGIPIFVPELSRHFLLSENKTSINNGTVCTKAFLYDKISDIQIRSRQPGDRIRIRHIGTVKLKEYFINNKIPSYRRGGVGLVAQGGDVLWILDDKNICNEEYVSPGCESQQIYIHVWE